MTLRLQWEGPRLTVQTVDEGGAVLGHVVQRVLADEAEIEWIEVRTVARRHGLGRALLEEAMCAAFEAGARTMYLEVRESNQAAQGLYRSLGFQLYGRREDYYSAPVEAAVLWRRDLTGGVSR